VSRVGCKACHGAEVSEYVTHRHGIKVGGQRPLSQVCGDCHGRSHSIVGRSDPSSPVYRSHVPALCSRCHSDPDSLADGKVRQPGAYITYMASVHGRASARGVSGAAVCTDCHGTHSLLPASDADSKIFRGNVPATCGACHAGIAVSYENSVHGKALRSGVMEAPACTDCHGEHDIRSPEDATSPVYAASISRTCSACHEAEGIVSKFRLPSDRVSTFEESYHGLAAQYGSLTVANCSSCHGYHDVLPSSDPASSVNKANLPKTCGKCHVGAGKRLAEGNVHSTPATSKSRVVHYVVIFYIGLIALVIGGMVLHNFLDLLRKLVEHFRQARAEGKLDRFLPTERVQHIVLAVTFVVLAYTGFAIKYPMASWAAPLRLFDNPEQVRGATHRVAAGLFIALSLYHAWFVFLTRRGRDQLRRLAPRLRDFSDLWLLTKYNLGLSVKRPTYSRYNYVEKSEYWALIWGSAIMVASGLLLVFEEFTLKYFPLWFSELATAVHFYEAVLASAAIVVWHFYWSIFDPHSYPMNWTWITGRLTHKQLEEREPEKGQEKED
jgi:cytochrome b subunit of formate dehydrogenase